MRLILYLTVLLSYSLMFILIEAIKRKSQFSSEITRKMLHVTFGIATILWSNYLTKSEFILFADIFLIFFIINYKKKLMQSLNTTNRKTFGEITYVLGLLVYALLLYSQRNYFIFGILILMIPDATAGLINHFLKIPFKEAFHIFSYAIITFTIAILFLPLNFTLLFVFILTVVEFFSSYGLDNLTVPIAFSLLIKFTL